jgi:hypothetical protein
MKIELEEDSIKRILAALSTERNTLDLEIKSLDDLLTGRAVIMNARIDFVETLKEEEEELRKLASYLSGMIREEEETE